MLVSHSKAIVISRSVCFRELFTFINTAVAFSSHPCRICQSMYFLFLPTISIFRLGVQSRSRVPGLSVSKVSLLAALLSSAGVTGVCLIESGRLRLLGGRMLGGWASPA